MFGPLFWNVVADQVLKEVTAVSDFVAFVDDFLLLEAAKSRREPKAKLNRSLLAFTQACSNRGLKVATDKTEAVFFGNASSLGRKPIFKIVRDTIKIGSSMKYFRCHYRCEAQLDSARREAANQDDRFIQGTKPIRNLIVRAPFSPGQDVVWNNERKTLVLCSMLLPRLD